MKLKKTALKLDYFVIVSMLTASLSVFGLDYTITFTGSGKNSTFDSVLVYNVTKGTNVKVPVGNVLNLTDTITSLDELKESEKITLFPNPMQERSTISFVSPQSGIVQLNVIGLDGRKVAGKSQFLNQGKNSFQISLPRGVFIIQVQGNGFSYLAKSISQSISCNEPEINYTETNNQVMKKLPKSKEGITEMSFTFGDLLLYKGYFAGYTSIITDIPTESKNIRFNFINAMDIDGNVYHTVTIGTQVWMVENLKVTKYSNGDPIPMVTDNYTWGQLTSGAYCDYDNSLLNGTKYGHLYNWFVVEDTRKVAPQGWHVPSDEDWIILTEYLGGESIAGGKMKDAGDANWFYPNRDATNESGFTGLPSGLRTYNYGSFINKGSNGYFWSSTAFDNLRAYDRELFYDQTNCFRYYYDSKRYGFSIRCVKD